MANTPYQGFLSQYGLNLDPEKLRQQDLQKRQAQALALTQGLGPMRSRQAAGAQVGAMLAGALSHKYDYKLSLDEERRIETAKNAGNEMNRWLKDNPTATDKDRALIYHKLLAESAFKAGLPDVGAQAMQTFEQMKLAREKQDLELRNLGADVKQNEIRAELAPEAAKAERTGWGLKKRVTAWPTGSNNPNDALDLTYETDTDGKVTGNLVDAQGNVIYRAGEWTSNVPDPAVGASGAGGAGAVKMTDSQAEPHRQIHRAAIEMMDGVEKLDDLITRAATRDAGVDVLGWGGAVAASATEIADNIDSTMSNIGKALGLGAGGVEVEVGYNKDGSKKYVDGRSSSLMSTYQTDIDSTIRKYINPEFRATGKDAIRIRQNLMNIAYAIMRSKEPGNNRYSDADFKNALELAGTGLADPEKLRATLYDRTSEALRSWDITEMQLGQDLVNQVVHPKGQQYFNQRRQKFEQRFGAYKVPSQAEQKGTPTVTQDDEGWSLVQ